MNVIGTLNENSLHDQIKSIYATGKAHTEVPLEGYHIDVIKGKRLIEIQTRSFTSIKKKLAKLLETHKVTLVYPLIVEKTIIVYDKKQKMITSKRRSPKKANIFNIFDELVYIPHLINHKNLTFDVIHVKVNEIRISDGKGSWRRKGVSLVDKELTEVVGHTIFRKPTDFLSLLPKKLPKEFSTKDLKKGGIKQRQIYEITYVFKNAGLIELVRKEGNLQIFKIN
ncbi:hypothetical protein KC614_01975 [candidate division WWE3 bacterium]|uniref:DUF8091 domain-containing protein n=1 Tax=candidate division WWE3 bacterium TaxID=2053526 RepID=A0A955LKD9_UNCKA|nr:hypothetical protein [candidate division WWE3 bacterium]